MCTPSGQVRAQNDEPLSSPAGPSPPYGLSGISPVGTIKLHAQDSPSRFSCTDKPVHVVIHPAVTGTCTPERKHLKRKTVLLGPLQRKGGGCSAVWCYGKEMWVPPQPRGRATWATQLVVPCAYLICLWKLSSHNYFIKRALACKVAKDIFLLSKFQAECAHTRNPGSNLGLSEVKTNITTNRTKSSQVKLCSDKALASQTHRAARCQGCTTTD